MFAKIIMHYHPQAIACIYAQENPIQNRCNDVWGQTVFYAVSVEMIPFR